jgi:hypothetical protein
MAALPEAIGPYRILGVGSGGHLSGLRREIRALERPETIPDGLRRWLADHGRL